MYAFRSGRLSALAIAFVLTEGLVALLCWAFAIHLSLWTALSVGVALGCLLQHLRQPRFAFAADKGPPSGPQRGADDEPTQVPVVWWIAGGVIAVGALAGAALTIPVAAVVTFFKTIRAVGVRSPLSFVEVGGTDSIDAGLFYKPANSDPDIVGLTTSLPGSLTFTITAGTNFTLAGASPLTMPAPAGNADAVVTGTAIGRGTVRVTGSDATNTPYTPMEATVITVAPMANALDLYRAAAEAGQDTWFNGHIGNLVSNLLDLPPSGLCDQWADWGARFLAQHNKGQICRIEKVSVKTNWFWYFPTWHQLMRVTLIENCARYYCDPWGIRSKIVYTAAEWESSYAIDPTMTTLMYTAPGGCDCP